eukprot:3424422-Pyramimonas_sp.AAC.1
MLPSLAPAAPTPAIIGTIGRRSLPVYCLRFGTCGAGPIMPYMESMSRLEYAVPVNCCNTIGSKSTSKEASLMR